MMLVSVYIPTKDRLSLLKRAIASVEAQTYRPIELIVVDDGSSDGTRDFLLGKSSCGQLVAVFNDESRGACVARNAGITACKGEFVTGLDDDDYFNPERIERFVERWRTLDRGVAGLFDSVFVLTARGQVVRNSDCLVTPTQLRARNRVGNFAFAPRSHYLSAGMFDPEMPAWQDWDLWIRMSKLYGDFVNINCTSCVIDELHGGTRISSDDERRIRAAKDLLGRKLEPMTVRERASLIASLYEYPQVRPRLSELSTLLVGGHFRSAARSIRRLPRNVS